jgi:hypothetical protein
MSIETVAVMGSVIIPFVLFAVVLFWAERQTNGISH